MMKSSLQHLKNSHRWSVLCLLGAFVFLATSLILIDNPRLNGFCYAAEKDSNLSYGRPSFVELSKMVKPAVVNIRTEKVVKGRDRLSRYYSGPNMPRDFFGEDFFNRFFGEGPEREYKERSLGSGFVISKDGYILTNNHVVEGADKIKVRLSDDKEFDGSVIGKDPKTDLALIKVEADLELPTLELGDSDSLEVGEWVMAIGNPFGLEHTVTVGVVSAKGRVIGAGPYDDFIQTDASINPGNSGGPLVNIKGEVIGINTAIIAQGQGIGFAIPVKMAQEIVPQLKDKGRVVRGWLGVLVQKVTSELAESFGLPEGKGALVAKVEEESPAAKGGIEEGDIIITFDGQEIKEMDELPRIVAITPVGEKVKVVIFRDGKEKTLKVKVGEMPEEKTEAFEKEKEQDLGMTVQELTPELANRLGLVDDEGVIVRSVEPGGPAEEAGIKRGDVIRELNRKPISDMDGFAKAIEKAKKDDNILLFVKRGEDTLYVVLKPEEEEEQ
jgi:serine protease Do